jgi:hypothetical protein
MASTVKSDGSTTTILSMFRTVANAPSRLLPLRSGQPLHPGNTTHHPGLTLTRRHQGFTHVHRSSLPLTCDSRMEREPLGLNPELRTLRLPATHVRAGTGLEQ